MGGDSAISGAYSDLLATPKIVRRGGWLIGVSGDCCVTQVIEHAFRPPDFPARMDADEYITLNFISEIRACLAKHKQSKGTASLVIAGRGDIWNMDSTFAVTRSREPFTVVGSGSLIALGAMHVTPDVEPRKRILAALRAAERWTDSVRGPFIVKKL